MIIRFRYGDLKLQFRTISIVFIWTQEFIGPYGALYTGWLKNMVPKIFFWFCLYWIIFDEVWLTSDNVLLNHSVYILQLKKYKEFFLTYVKKTTATSLRKDVKLPPLIYSFVIFQIKNVPLSLTIIIPTLIIQNRFPIPV